MLMIKLRGKNDSQRPNIDVCDILKLAGCKKFTKKVIQIDDLSSPFRLRGG